MRDTRRNLSLKHVHLKSHFDEDGRYRTLMAETDDLMFEFNPDESIVLRWHLLDNGDEKQTCAGAKKKKPPEFCYQEDPQAYKRLEDCAGKLMCSLRRCLDEETDGQTLRSRRLV